MADYDYDGDMSYFQDQLSRAGITVEKFDINNYAGLTKDELQELVNNIIRLIKSPLGGNEWYRLTQKP